jgi:hypothetical protein
MPTVSPKKVEVDIEKIESDIREKEALIEALIRERDSLVYWRKYALNGHSSGSQGQPTKGRVKKTVRRKKISKPLTGISEFILTLLKGGETNTKDIISGWSRQVGIEYNKVSNNVSNALNRLKIAGKIESRESEGGKRAGNIWFLKR